MLTSHLIQGLYASAYAPIYTDKYRYPILGLSADTYVSAYAATYAGTIKKYYNEIKILSFNRSFVSFYHSDVLPQNL